MGLFSFFADVGRKLVGGVVDGFGRCVEKVGEVTGWEGLEMAGINMQIAADDISSGVGKTSSYDDSCKNVRQVESLSSMLADYSRSVESDADKMQEAIEQNIRNFYNDLWQYIESSDVDLPQNMLKREQASILNSLYGFLKNYVSKRISLDDKECVDILKMEKGPAKTNAMKAFTNRGLREAKQQLCTKLNNLVESGLDDFYSAFDNMLNVKQVQLEQAERHLAAFRDDTPGREYELVKCKSVINGLLLVEQICSEEIA